MHVDDLARALLYFMENCNSSEIVNVGWGEDISIKELSALIALKVRFSGDVRWDTSKPDGMLKKCMDVTKMRNMGFNPRIILSDGISDMIKEYRKLKSSNAL